MFAFGQSFGKFADFSCFAAIPSLKGGFRITGDGLKEIRLHAAGLFALFYKFFYLLAALVAYLFIKRRTVLFACGFAAFFSYFFIEFMAVSLCGAFSAALPGLAYRHIAFIFCH
jgi:hypothetical protein